MTAATKSFISGNEVTAQQIIELFELSEQIKLKPEYFQYALRGKHIAMMFEKPSLRTKASFQVGIEKLGGQAHFYDMQSQPIGARESLKDICMNLSQWYDAIVARVNCHSTLQKMSAITETPIVNALCDKFHPCQALADLFTLYEIDTDFSHWHIAYFGFANNVTRSLIQIAHELGVKLSVVCHSEASFSQKEMALWQQSSAGKIQFLNDPDDLISCDVIYTDVWQSMGQQKLSASLKQSLQKFQVNRKVMAASGAKFFMHCQPVHRGEEVCATVCDSNYSIMYQQSRNRMITQQALVYSLFSGKLL